MVAVYNDDLYSALLFKGFELCGKSLVTRQLTVEGQVAGDEYIVALLGNSLLERRVDKGVGFVVLAVAPVVPCVVGFAESVLCVPCSFFGISKIVNVGEVTLSVPFSWAKAPRTPVGTAASMSVMQTITAMMRLASLPLFFISFPPFSDFI